jgi:hypothetical protein
VIEFSGTKKSPLAARPRGDPHLDMLSEDAVPPRLSKEAVGPSSAVAAVEPLPGAVREDAAVVAQADAPQRGSQVEGSAVLAVVVASQAAAVRAEEAPFLVAAPPPAVEMLRAAGAQSVLEACCSHVAVAAEPHVEHLADAARFPVGQSADGHSARCAAHFVAWTVPLSCRFAGAAEHSAGYAPPYFRSAVDAVGFAQLAAAAGFVVDVALSHCSQQYSGVQRGLPAASWLELLQER